MDPLSFLRTHHKSLSVSRIYNGFIYYLRIHSEINIFLADSLLIHYLFCDFTNCFALLLWIHYLSFKFNLNSLFISGLYKKIHYLFREFCLTSQSFPRIHFEIIIFSRIYFEFTIYFSHWLYQLAKILRIHYLFNEFTMTSLSLSWNHYDFTIKSSLLWFQYLFRGLTIN